MIDLAAGLTVVGAWIAWREGPRRALPWWIALLLTGNLATGVYVIKAAKSSSNTDEFLTGRRAGAVR